MATASIMTVFQVKKKNLALGILPKLLISFLGVAIIPLVLVGYMAGKNMQDTGTEAIRGAEQIGAKSLLLAEKTGKRAIEDAIRALDDKATEAIELRTEELARRIADFLYERDQDILVLATIVPDAQAYLQTYRAANREVIVPGEWPPIKSAAGPKELSWQNPENKQSWRHRPPPGFTRVPLALYREITFVDLTGREKIKIVDGKISDDLRDVSKKEQTYCKAEEYFSYLAGLSKGDISVSRVIGGSVKGWLHQTPDGLRIAAESGYAGKENPHGRKFAGIIRWATPVFTDQGKVGYLTMALDHTHVMEFTDHVVPTSERYSAIADAGSGNYAWLWDDQDQCISHPRDFFICGFDPHTGREVPGWLSQQTYDEYTRSGLPLEEFVQALPSFREFSITKRGAREQIVSGDVALDCRVLDTAPQCQGWHTGTEDGGSGSFLIFWSGLWKLTTYAAVPYYSGMYGQSKRGFGYVTLGANVEDFHQAANSTRADIEKTIIEQAADIEETTRATRAIIEENSVKNRTLTFIVAGLSAFLVIGASIMLSLNITRPLKRLTHGAEAMCRGELEQHIATMSHDEIGTLTQSFNQMARKIAEVDRMKSEFVTIASHELRTPIHAMLLGISGLLAGYSGDIDEEVREDLQIVNQGLSRLTRLVEDLLNISRIEAGRNELNIDLSSVADIIDDAVNEVQELVAEHDHTLSKNVPADLPQINVDRDRIVQVVINILSNAIKYSPDGGRIILDVTTTEAELLISITDNGYGIPSWAKEKIFEKFFQADSIMSKKVGGSGLGLCLTQGIVAEHGGSITLVSPVPLEPYGHCTALALGGERCGSIFTIRLPLSR